ncbi:MAG: aminotransferase class V-fold PLP-dependent enzyme [Natronospirillum sp.]|uniref:aminotransferase class V-fold PLP-dependent enzyme n=1 Tax=Natronospirillum sp. TaxID=2812955 RepID=UPI0025D319A0|nr:aminotransferase class V-fold PLP-dependent enzyme [Natronospirillum sp.]MCH8552302.1 aminotransferase class V-fold PLP-dependent enzyme [Natronospirillum sp.]
MKAQPAAQQTDWNQIRQHTIDLPGGRLYADWTASGRLYRPIEERLIEEFGPWMANTHTEDSLSGQFMTGVLQEAETMLRQHVNAGERDVLLFAGNGMTGALAKLIRMLGLWVHEQHRAAVLAQIPNRPLVYITHMEHHSNHTPWLETLAEVKVIPATETGEVDLAWLAEDLQDQTGRPLLLASVTAASNVTGVAAPYRAIASLLHQYQGYCLVDFACAAPYVDIDMHPADEEPLDAVFFSPHKFLGGPGSSGVLVFNRGLYHNRVPDQPGGGTVLWTNPWGEHRYFDDIAERESGGTPGVLQAIKAALAAQLKKEMGTADMAHREQLLNQVFFERLDECPGVQVLASHQRQRLSVFSLLFNQVHYSEAVQQLSREWGIEARGGCGCAGTYGHYLLDIDRATSQRITSQLDQGDLSVKPGWVRLSFHPMMTVKDVERIADAVRAVSMPSGPTHRKGKPGASSRDQKRYSLTTAVSPSLVNATASKS